MKKIKILLLSLSFLLTFNLFSASLDIRYADMKISGGNLVFDIEIRSDVGTTYLGGLQVYINYNVAAFGSSIYPLNVTVEQIGLLTANYTVSVGNTTTSRLGINAVRWPTTLAASNVLTSYSKVLRITIPIINASENAGITFHCSIMQNQSMYY